MGVDRAELTAGYPARQRLRLRSPAGRTADRQLREDVFVIPRLVFDARLMAAAQARGAVLSRHTVRQVRQLPGGVEVDGELRCSVLVAADGAESVVRRLLGHRSQPLGHLAVAIRGYGSELPGQDGAQVIAMGGRRWPSYAWSFPTGDGAANIGYGEVMASSGVNRADLLAGLSELFPDAGELTNVRGHRLPLSTRRPVVEPGRVLLAGDAQSLINPLSGEGIYYAVRSGMLAADAAAAGEGAGKLYRLLLHRWWGRHLRHTGALSRLTRRPTLIEAGVAAAARHQGAFDDLVDLSLADGLITGRLLRNLRYS